MRRVIRLILPLSIAISLLAACGENSTPLALVLAPTETLAPTASVTATSITATTGAPVDTAIPVMQPNITRQPTPGASAKPTLTPGGGTPIPLTSQPPLNYKLTLTGSTPGLTGHTDSIGYLA